MPRVTFSYAALLIALGVIGYFVTGRQSWTALIPTLFGVIFLLLGLMALKPHLRKHAMHAAAALALVGFLATVKGVIALIQMGTGATIPRPEAAVVRAIMAILSLIYLLICVRSFIAARRNRAPGFEVAPKP